MAAVYYHEGQFPPDKRLDWHRLVLVPKQA